MTSQTQFTPEIIQAFVTGTLDPETAAKVTAAAKADPDMSAEIAIWRSARAVQADTVAEVASRDAGALGWARVERAINEIENPRSANDNTGENLGSIPLWSRPLIAPWQAAAAVALAILGWQFLVAPVILAEGSEQQDAYVLAGAQTGQDFAFRVAFTDNATASNIAAILRGVGGRIIDGPSAMGFYTIAFDDPEAMDDAREALSESSGEVVAEVTDQ